MSTPEPAPAPAPTPSPKPKMKRWKKVFFITGGAIGGLFLFILIFGPAIIGSVARSQIASRLGERLDATVTMGDLSFSWSGRIRIDDFRIVPKNFTEPLIEVKKVDVALSLPAAIAGRYLADMDVTAPRILVEKGAHGKFNYEFPPRPTKERKPKKSQPGQKRNEDEELPFVRANVRIHDGEVTIRGRGRETVYRNVSVTSAIDTLEKPVAFDVALDQALKIKGAIDVDSLSGPATVTFDRFSLKNLTGAARAYSSVAELDGSVTGSLDYQLQGAPRFAGKGSLEIRNFAVALPGQTINLDRVTFTHEGAIDDKGSGRHVIRLNSGKALNAALTVDVTDAFNTRVAKTDLQIDADLAAIPAQPPIAGAVQVRGTCNSKGPTAADLEEKKLRVAADVDLLLTGRNVNVAMGGKPIKLELLEVHHTGTLDETGTGKSTVSIESNKAVVAQLQVQMTNGDLRIDGMARPAELSKIIPDLKLGGSNLGVTAAVKLQPKLDVDATVKSTAFEWNDKGYSAKGGIDARLKYADHVTTGSTRLSNLEVVDEKKQVVREPALTIVHDIGLDQSIDLRKVEVESTFLRGTIVGKIDRAGGLEFRNLRCAFKYHPEKLGAFAKPWLPGKLEGTEEKTLDVVLNGKAASMDPLAIVRGSTGSVDLDLARFTRDGLTVSGKTQFKLQAGKVTSGTPLEVNQGRSDLNALLDFNPKEKNPKSTLTFNAKDVDANGQMGPLLEKINPIFHTSGLDAKVDGKIQSEFKLAWAGPIDPDEKEWKEAAARSLSGGGTFGATNLNIAGSPAVGKIMAALGQGNLLQGELVATQVRIEGGKCLYESMTLRGSRKDGAALKRDQEQLAADRKDLEEDKPHLQPKEYASRLEELKQREEDLPFRYTLKFSGWVGFDRKLQLRVLMPMTSTMIKSHPNLQKYIGTSFWVDLTGTVDRPSLDLQKMLTTAAKRAAEGILAEKATDLLGRLLKDKKRESEAEKLFTEAQQAETEKNLPLAADLYKKALNDYRDTEFVKKKKKNIEERISRLQGK